MAKTLTAAIEVPSMYADGDDASEEDDLDVADGDDASEDDDLDLNYGGDEPEVTKIICKEH
jgi:hypothetical protein